MIDVCRCYFVFMYFKWPWFACGPRFIFFIVLNKKSWSTESNAFSKSRKSRAFEVLSFFALWIMERADLIGSLMVLFGAHAWASMYLEIKHSSWLRVIITVLIGIFILLPGGIQKAIGPARTAYTTHGSLPDAQLAASTPPIVLIRPALQQFTSVK